MKIRNILKGLIVSLAILVGGNAFANDGWNGRGLSDGLVVSFYGNNNKFLSSENGSQAMRCNRSVAAAWEKFTIVNNSNNNPTKVYLKANNGKYVRVLSNNRLKADVTSISNATLFTSDDNSNNAGQHTLYAGDYLSSENGAIPVRANRSAVGTWERWDVQAY